MKTKTDRICARVVSLRPQIPVSAGFTGRVMAHVRERAEEALEGWFVRRVAMPLMAGGGAVSVAFGLAWLWLWQAGYLAEFSLYISGSPMAGF
jgi:hypothetical protein